MTLCSYAWCWYIICTYCARRAQIRQLWCFHWVLFFNMSVWFENFSKWRHPLFATKIRYWVFARTRWAVRRGRVQELQLWWAGFIYLDHVIVRIISTSFSYISLNVNGFWEGTDRHGFGAPTLFSFAKLYIKNKEKHVPLLSAPLFPFTIIYESIKKCDSDSDF